MPSRLVVSSVFGLDDVFVYRVFGMYGQKVSRFSLLKHRIPEILDIDDDLGAEDQAVRHIALVTCSPP